MFDWWRRLSRADVLAAPFPEEYERLLVERVPLVRWLGPAERDKLEALVRILLSEKDFEGAGGLELTEAMRVVIAARACLLVLHRVELDEPLFPDLDTIIVYPSAYRAQQVRHEGHVVIEGEQARLGESWTRGVIVLSWDAVQSGGANTQDGHDVVLHEFAHQLDGEDGVMDGTPELDSMARYASWSSVLGAEFAALRAAVERRRKSDIDAYGATNEPEFFAVVVEAFFEKPVFLERKHPELYAELAAYFRFDPAELVRTAS
ncbi:MAG TPA: M90 family metallopeptidase [Polyangiaceae bacterium]|nr:M90 family metallopeptidase [Polyangiaceae bacterium]